jgi:secreted PhoX family phosphatase
MKRLLLASTILALSAGHSQAADPAVVAVRFTATPAPATEAEMIAAYTRSTAEVTYGDGTRKSFPLSHHVLMIPGQSVAGQSVGLVIDHKGQPIERVTTEDGRTARGPFHAYAPDANSLILAKGGPRLITHFEYHTEADGIDLYRRLPMLMSSARLAQDGKSGRLSVRAVETVDMAAIGGLWVPCAGTLTPWNTHLGSEEYEPNARTYETQPLEPMNLYLGTQGKTAAQGGANAYRYGHLVEVALKGGKPVATKHYAPGRLAFELADVQPDGRTLYYGDDGRDVVRFMFVADRVADLSAGTLYAARWQQTDGANGGKADLAWIRLGHATSDEIRGLVDKGIAFTDIFEVSDKAEPGFHPVYVYGGAQAKESAILEYLRVRSGMDQAAAFLESRRYAALRGATSEFTKMEGVTHDPVGRRLFTAMSYIEKGMLDGRNENRPQDHIRLSGDEKDLACGAVYESRLTGGQYDTDGSYIPSDWVAVDMVATVQGAKANGAKYDRCDTERVANPDNIKYSPALRTLFIGEDSGNHLNNFLWTVADGDPKPVRIFSAPAGAENTGLAVVESLGGHAYILANIQHPGAAEDLAKYPDAIKKDLRTRIDQRGSVGYLGGLPAFR